MNKLFVESKLDLDIFLVAADSFPVGVGRAEDLGTDIALVPNTSYLNLAYLKQLWKDR
ncbi:TPA: hypothetical protein ACGOVD_001186 [Streptococcus suis]